MRTNSAMALVCATCFACGGGGGGTPGAATSGATASSGASTSSSSGGGTCAKDDMDASKGTVTLTDVDAGTSASYGERSGGFAWMGVGKPADSVTWGKCFVPANGTPVEPGVLLDTEAPLGTYDVTQSQMKDIFQPGPTLNFTIPAADFASTGRMEIYDAGFAFPDCEQKPCGSGTITLTASDATHVAGTFDVVAFELGTNMHDPSHTKHFKGTFSATPKQ